MLVISGSLTLPADEAALPSSTPLILYDSLVTASNISSSSEDLNYPATNLANPATNQVWRADDSSSPVASDIEITVALTGVDPADAVGIVGHNFGTEGLVVEVGYYDNDSPDNWVTLAGPHEPADDAPILFWFTSQTLSSIVIRVSEVSSSPDSMNAGSATAAVIYVGKMLVMERSLDVDKDYVNPRFARRSEFAAARSERGDYLGRIVTSQWLDAIDHSFSHLTPEWYVTYAAPFVEAAEQDTPFFYAPRSDQDTTEVAFCWLTDDAVPMTNPVTGRKKLVLKMAGIAE